MKTHQWKTERLRGNSVTPVVLGTVKETTHPPKDMSTFWLSSENKLLLRNNPSITMLHEKSCTTMNIRPYWASYVWTVMTGRVWRAEHNMQDLESHSWWGRSPYNHKMSLIWSGDKTCVVISSATDVIIALLFYVPVFLQEGLTKLCEGAYIGCWYLSQLVPTWHARLGQNLCSILPAL